MRKFLFLIPVFLLLFGTRSLAYSDAVNDNFKEIVEEFYTGEFTSETYPIMVLTKWESLGFENYDCILTILPNNSCQTLLVLHGSYSINGNSISCNGFNYWLTTRSSLPNTVFKGTSTTFSFSVDNGSATFNTSSFRLITFDDLAITLEFDNILYDPSIPTPSSIYNWNEYDPRLDVSSFGVSQEVFGASYPEDLYFAYYIKVWTPKDVIISRSGSNPYFKIDSYYSHEPFYFNSYLVFEKVPFSNFFIDYDDEDTLMSWWNNIADNLNINYLGMTGDWSSVAGTIDPFYPSEDFTNSHKDAVMNKLEISTCFFVVRDGQIYSGMWEVWNNRRPYQTTLSQLSGSIEVPGTQIDGSQTVLFPEQAQSNAENLNQLAPDNINSGNNFTINVNSQQVPNSMDYPTIVSYNHDNIFTGFIDTYKTAGNTLGDFADFCSQTLVWIPSQIWSIIGIGFSMAIVIMIIKIL